MNKSLLMASLIAAVALAACGKKPEEVPAAPAMEAASAVEPAPAPAPEASAPAADAASAAASDAAAPASN